jgi:uncharacterized membrane protein
MNQLEINTQREINQAEWRDRDNWHWGIYNSPRDTRVWVSKSIPWTGWTLNFAHRAAWIWSFAIVMPAILVAFVVTVVSIAVSK